MVFKPLFATGSDFQGIDDLNISASLLLPDFDTENAACGSTHQPDVSIADIEDVTQGEMLDTIAHVVEASSSGMLYLPTIGCTQCS